MAFLLALVLVVSLPAQSVTISQEQLQELIRIWEAYGQIAERLEASLKSSEKRIDALESGFGEYRAKVEEELLPKAKALERQVVFLKWGFGAALAAALVAGAIAVLK